MRLELTASRHQSINKTFGLVFMTAQASQATVSKKKRKKIGVTQLIFQTKSARLKSEN